ncbi:MAG TPA: cupredoxin domain-containing protein [Gaiellaceae bacterium]|nr:cupredoxin domain-containing protein [Gaiellaceae bacterium]
MKRFLVIAIAVPVLLLTPAYAATKAIDITARGFAPNKVTIALGDAVTWTNKDTAAHQVVADQAKFTSSPMLAAGQSYSFTFTKSGVFTYHDGANVKKTGKVTVKPGVSLTAAPSTVRYGGSTTLGGTVSTGVAAETVTVNAEECGKKGFTKIATVMSGASGAWTFVAKPTINTTYQAGWKATKSAPLTVKVGPGVALTRVRRGRFTAAVTANQSFVGKYVVLQRFARSRRAWKTVKRVTLRTVKPGTAPAMISSAGFRTRVARKTRLRLLLIQSQAGSCYGPARSNTVRA